MPRVRLLSAFFLSLLAAAVLLAQTAPQPAPTGYFGASAPELFAFLPPAPTTGDARDAADRAIFRATRALDGSARWTLARRDDDLTVGGLLNAFACSLGAALSQENAPRLAALVARMSVDSNASVVSVKSRYQRKRPFLVDEGPICLAREGFLLTSFDYPSGHSTLGWATGLVLAEIAPDRAGVILARARAFGESRVICGVHNASAVETGRTAGASVVALLHGSEAFRTDLESAKREFLPLRSGHAPTSESCAAEAASVAVSPYSASFK